VIAERDTAILGRLMLAFRGVTVPGWVGARLAAAHGGAVGPGATAAPVDPTKSVVPRERTPLDVALIAGFVALAGVLGGLLVWRAERIGGVLET